MTIPQDLTWQQLYDDYQDWLNALTKPTKAHTACSYKLKKLVDNTDDVLDITNKHVVGEFFKTDKNGGTVSISTAGARARVFHTFIRECYDVNLGHTIFGKNNSMSVKITTAHDETLPLACSVQGCNFRCTSEYELEIHRLQEHDKNVFSKCGLCDNVTKHPTQHLINAHKNEYQTAKDNKCVENLFQKLSLSCRFCDLTFSTLQSLTKHIDMAHIQVSVTCPKCQKTLKSSALYDHLRSFHTENAYTHKCDLCKMEFKYSKLFDKHLKTKTHLDVVDRSKPEVQTMLSRAQETYTIRDHFTQDSYTLHKWRCNWCSTSVITTSCKRHFQMCITYQILGKYPGSYGEKIVHEYLRKNGYEYVYQKTFDDLGDQGQCYFFDFYLTQEHCIIEYNGLQHYNAPSWSDSEKSLKKTQDNDNIKLEYAKKNSIRIIIIDARIHGINVASISNFLDENL